MKLIVGNKNIPTLIREIKNKYNHDKKKEIGKRSELSPSTREKVYFAPIFKEMKLYTVSIKMQRTLNL